MIDPQDELFSLRDSAGLFPGVRPHIATVFRWAIRGVGQNRTRLETVMVGGRRYTTRAAVLEFIERLSRPATTVASHQLRQQAILAAESLLDSEGL